MGLFVPNLPKPRAWPPPHDRVDVAEAWSYGRRRDPVGDRCHLVLAVAALMALPVAHSVGDILFAVLLAYALLRLPQTWRTYPVLVREPLVWLLLAITGWGVCSLAWSTGGFDALGSTRAMLWPLMLWPVLDRIGVLIGAFLVGVVISHGMQVADIIGWTTPDAPGRFGGGQHPIQTGALCLTAMVWHLSAALATRGRMRWVSLAALLLATAGLLATGSRGPWLAAAVTMPLALAGIAIRRPPARRLAMVLGLIVLVNGLGGWPVAQRVLMPRVDRAITEVTAAVEADVYTTDAGLRVGLWRAAATIIRAHPIRGVGAGGFPAAYRETSIYRDAVGADPQSQAFMERDHPHSTPLNLLASYGLIGGGLAAAFVVLLLVRTVRMRNDHAYADGHLFVVVAWLVGMNFECYDMQSTMLGVLMLVTTAALRDRPPARPGGSAA